MTARLLLVLPVIALLAACTTGGGGGGDTGGGGDSGGGDGGTAAGDCSDFGAEYAPFTSDLIASQSGSTWGDGSEFAIQLSDSAIAADILPQVEFLSNVNGGVQTASSQILDDLGDGAYSNSLNLFDSQFDGQPGIARVFAIDDSALDGERYDGDSLLLGDYCITLEVE
ncbi:MAG: hypothetical protein ABI566_09075 [Pseudolysinimonas sp.]